MLAWVAAALPTKDSDRVIPTSPMQALNDEASNCRATVSPHLSCPPTPCLAQGSSFRAHFWSSLHTHLPCYFLLGVL